jgi:predicted DNA-binding antitoxin AbrB/MazE fold protein
MMQERRKAMHALSVEAIYEQGTLKLPQKLPLEDGQKVTITIHAPGSAVDRLVGSVPWHGPVEALDTLITSAENDPLEAS